MSLFICIFVRVFYFYTLPVYCTASAYRFASVLQEAGYRTGLYTSPHLKDFRERVRVNGAMISEEQVVRLIEKHREAFDAIKPRFFE